MPAATRIALALAFCLVQTTAALSGAWPREKGRVFLSVATRVNAPLEGWISYQGINVYHTAYLEYGLGHDWTAGLDIGHGISGEHKAIVFLRRPIFRSDGGFIVALEMGVGIVADEPTLRPGLSLGQGLGFSRGRSGWLSLESYGEVRLESRRTDLKADVTYGVNHSDRFKSIWQIQSGVSSGDPSFVRFAPSVVWKIGRKAHIEIGTSAYIAGGDAYGLKLGVWREF